MEYSGITTTLIQGGGSIGPSEELCNYTADYCSDRMKEPEVGRGTAIALIRMVTSILSILGTASIIVSVLIKRQVKSSKVHPIFVLSIADFLLAVLWVVGGVLWLTGVSKYRVWCFMATLTTAILECVAINLTFVYALYAYAHITHMNLSSLIRNHFNPSHGWSKLKVALVYITAWLLPTVLVMVPFGFVAGLTNVLRDANWCSCGCVPKFLNVLPLPANSHQYSYYMDDIARVDICLAVVIAAHYIIAFPLLVVYYYRVLKHIRKIRRDHEGNTSSSLYGATEAVIVRGHSQAKHRVFLFLTVFVITGLCNLVLACLLTVFLSLHLVFGIQRSHSHTLKIIVIVTLIVQSITVPLQGFLNAIVYGWTREDFLYIMAATNQRKPLKEPPQINEIDSVYENDEALSDLESSYGESDGELFNYRRSRQQTPETNMSGNWS